jgi:hypothetical protein
MRGFVTGLLPRRPVDCRIILTFIHPLFTRQ